ncbi:AbrB/MazE/SpoVT family DNA-binding domain-containing protein [Desulfatitalea alkaliphila]|uniref:AbrB/MazE/SpoVT family DNA-binding domain-containing protein n=1 Tax=Desulfatitalea alkaliphila TaxID=2929485 RepID=A0AA41UHT7_9BACT|nr:AbrB/MazE/SpoVT family DNA-binding domain-containing protein [Desulfatitalea alkaliphila]MCJ8499364.1 AbrB/MazE/SpoVT family DNA-binding domain-containing protein [Desulfatitalea alkaliphila]
MESTKSKVTSKGQIVIPKQIRMRYGIKPATVIRWVQKDEGVLLIPDSENAVTAARGMLPKTTGLLAKLMAARRADRENEDRYGKNR